MTKTTAKAKTTTKTRKSAAKVATTAKGKKRLEEIAAKIEVDDIDRKNDADRKREADAETDAILAAMDAQADAAAEDFMGDAAPVEKIDKEAVYAEQDSELSVDNTETPAEAPKSSRKKKSPAAAKSVRKPRVIMASSLSKVYDEPEAVIANIDNLPKKVQDKARNAMMAMAGDTRLSQYTKYALDALTASEDGTIEVADIRSLLINRGYKDGTASAQAQQQMVLLPFLGVASRTGSKLTAIGGKPTVALTEATA